MKAFKLLSLLLLVGCYGFGYHWNPYTVLEKAQDAIINQDVYGMTEVTSEHALCTYASRDGLKFLANATKDASRSIELDQIIEKPNVEFYQAKIRSSQGKLLAKTMIRCKHEDNAHWCNIVAIKTYNNQKRIVDVCEDLNDFDEILKKLRKN